MGLPRRHRDLVGHSSPLAVAGCVVSVVVNAVERHPRRALPHIGEKVREVVPAVANHNAFSTIVLPAGIGLSVTARHHRLPTFVGWGWVRAVSMLSSALVASGVDALARKTLGRIAAVQRGAAYGVFRATIAADVPHCVFAFLDVRKAKDRQPTKSLTTKVDPCAHALILA